MNLRFVSASVLLHAGFVSAVAVWAGLALDGRSDRPPALTFVRSEPAQPFAEAAPRTAPFEVEPASPPVPNAPPPPAEPLAELEQPTPSPRLHRRPPIDPLRNLRTNVRLRPPAEPETPPAPPPRPEPRPPTPAPAPTPESGFVAARALTSQNRKPDYPREAILRGWTGTVVVHLSIDAAGLVTDARIVTASRHPVLNRAALRAARGWRFEPARRDGQPVSSEKDLPIDFELTDR